MSTDDTPRDLRRLLLSGNSLVVSIPSEFEAEGFPMEKGALVEVALTHNDDQPEVKMIPCEDYDSGH